MQTIILVKKYSVIVMMILSIAQISPARMIFVLQILMKQMIGWMNEQAVDLLGLPTMANEFPRLVPHIIR